MSDVSNDVRTKVLIAEDDAIVALDLQGQVMRLGFDVVAIVENGQTAVAAARRFSPDVILLDMVLPGSMDGIEVAREIHRHLDIPIVFCVSSPDLALLSRAKDISFAGYLLKPINPDSLATTLDTVLYKYKLEKRVKQAEEKFLRLSETCDVIKAFTDSGSVATWSWTRESGVTLDTDDGIAIAPREDLTRAIDAAARSRADTADLAKAGFRIADYLEIPVSSAIVRYALIGYGAATDGAVKGILVPLAGSSA